MYHLRMSKKGKEVMVKASEIAGITVSDVMRKVAAQMRSGRIQIGTEKRTVSIIRKSGAVVNIKITPIYYKELTEILDADMTPPDVRYPSHFREAIIGACIDLINNYETKHKEEIALKAKLERQLSDFLIQKHAELRGIM